MFGLFKRKKPYAGSAAALYKAVLGQVSRPAFYTGCGVPDSFSGRFELITVHAFIIMHCAENAALNQALFDEMFSHMDQNLREMGIGDVGVPKYMRRLMKGFNGRVHAYEAALEDRNALAAALGRNLYAAAEAPPDKAMLEKMTAYIQGAAGFVKTRGREEIMAGRIVFPDMELV